jgi:hypothetical protein
MCSLYKAVTTFYGLKFGDESEIKIPKGSFWGISDGQLAHRGCVVITSRRGDKKLIVPREEIGKTFILR